MRILPLTLYTFCRRAPLEPLTTCHLPRSALSVAQVLLLPQEIVLPAADIFELLPGDIPVLVICPCPALPPVLIMPWFLHVAFLHPIPGLCLLFLGSRFEMKIAGLCWVKLCRPEHCFNRERTVVGLVPACQDPTLCHGFACHLCADHSQSLWYLSLLS